MIKLWINNKMIIVESEKEAMKLIEEQNNKDQKGIRQSI